MFSWLRSPHPSRWRRRAAGRPCRVGTRQSWTSPLHFWSAGWWAAWASDCAAPPSWIHQTTCESNQTRKRNIEKEASQRMKSPLNQTGQSSTPYGQSRLIERKQKNLFIHRSINLNPPLPKKFSNFPPNTHQSFPIDRERTCVSECRGSRLFDNPIARSDYRWKEK